MKILENHNIRLVPLSSEHEHEYVKLANNQKINPRINLPAVYTNEHFAEELAKTKTEKARFVWMIEQDGVIIGVVNSGARANGFVFQGGYWIDPIYWGRGAASKSLSLVNEFVFNECRAERIQALVEPDNIASIRVLEKCGYQREGLLRKYYPSVSRGLLDVVMYAIVR